MNDTEFEQQILPDRIYTYGDFQFTGQELLDGSVNMGDVIATYPDTVAIDLVDKIDDEGKAFFMIATEE
ncbi:hypothetical protein [Furfurilactobacillus milii]|uniref:Uncharacterized protein n=1 Tax=Furfurilactobacillus milii TaxID=2888272 RepID=A0ABT6DCP8_9LACO|nr:hypothetical protein [Furfurilactobacillus milii]QLE67445.1 hypothetical protein LROSL2_2127 [Furfurilactobacillus rossiae]MCF6161876.1 hypothetical protein [Furfurilactobacillus milii]MCF6164256.1 hypothetical protein [Furfurilactobacillus milii]MDF9914881.1 hypothetical protein [Furfurilactobacillus milii]QLE69874.1 hypothetical protein LROSL3_2153 [Furfurilactobacillus rossiae]